MVGHRHQTAPGAVGVADLFAVTEIDPLRQVHQVVDNRGNPLVPVLLYIAVAVVGIIRPGTAVLEAVRLVGYDYVYLNLCDDGFELAESLQTQIGYYNQKVHHTTLKKTG